MLVDKYTEQWPNPRYDYAPEKAFNCFIWHTTPEGIEYWEHESRTFDFNKKRICFTITDIKKAWELGAAWGDASLPEARKEQEKFIKTLKILPRKR
jgi:hypothetical protein